MAVLVSHDITEQVERERQNTLMQERLEQTQRLESLGVLAGGIAHDFNNLLMAILGNADVALMKLALPSPAEKNLETIKSASLRAADLCSQLRAYSGQGKIEEKEFSLSKLVDEMAQMLTTSIAKKSALHLNLQKQIPMIVGDSPQIREIVLDLVMNASEAIGDNDGTITLSTGDRYCSLNYFTDDFVLKPTNSGIFVTMEVSDNGPGMNKEILARIFEPFYTSKFTGRGLGLSAVLGVIRSHGGGLRVSSEPGVGTTVTVFLPGVEETMAENSANPASVEPGCAGNHSQWLFGGGSRSPFLRGSSLGLSAKALCA